MAANSSPPDVRWDVISRLQSLQNHAVPGSRRCDVAEHAVDLALSAKRAADNPETLLARVLEDSGRVIRRRRRRARELFIADLRRQADPVNDEGDFADPPLRGLSAPVTPEDIVIARGIEAELRDRISATYPHDGPRCLDGMLTDETLDETATALGTSTRRVKRIRAAIRRLAVGVFFLRAA